MHWVLVVGAQLLVSAIFCAIGFVMAFRPTLYRRWVQWSWAGRHMPTVTDNWLRRSWNFRAVGIVFIIFGMCSFAMFLWIDFVQ